MNLEINGARVRVACPGRLARRLRAALRDHVIDDEAPLGFIVQSGRLHRHRYTLVDRCGFVLGTADGGGPSVTMLGSHLSALAPSDRSHVRLRARALIGDGQAILCLYPVLFIPPLNEQLLVDAGYAVVDRLAVDIETATGVLMVPPLPWPPLQSGVDQAGHASTAGPQPITAIITMDPNYLSPAAVACAIAQAAMSGDRSRVLETSVRLTEQADVRRVSISDRAGLQKVLEARS